jgi:hypothetical protein
MNAAAALAAARDHLGDARREAMRALEAAPPHARLALVQLEERIRDTEGRAENARRVLRHAA